MPSPPRKGEAKEDFISRCVSEIAKEEPEREPQQRLAICHSMWMRAKGIKDVPPK